MTLLEHNYQLDRDKQIILIEEQKYTKSDFITNQQTDFASKSDFHFALYLFLKDWFSDSEYLQVQTSGSTRQPKSMQVEKRRMMNSAQLTCSFLNLHKNDTALLCMSLDYIAGKMVVVRALVAGLDLYPITPCGNPLANTYIEFDFGAMIPMQVFNSMNNKQEYSKLSKIRNLIIGGGSIDSTMANTIKKLNNNIYSTYGMTETLSHIALRKLNGEDASEYYTLFDSVKINTTKDGCLIIDAPLVSEDRLITNDIVKINEKGQFKIIGRKDNVINSGGVKIQIEEIENQLKPHISCSFAITSLPDVKFGDIIVLVSEEEVNNLPFDKILSPYSIPKKIFVIDAMPMTETGKISRKLLKEKVLQIQTNSEKT